jgi:transcription elongation factor GreB
MSRAFVKDDNEDRPSEELPERPISNEPNYVTAEGLEALRARVEALAAEHAKLKQAAEDFDKPRLATIERDLRYFQSRLESAIPVVVADEPTDEVHFGATVRTEDEKGEIDSFTIVGEDEADIAKAKVSWLSPLAKALIGAKVGDIVTWNRPAGAVNLEVLEIRYPQGGGQKKK